MRHLEITLDSWRNHIEDLLINKGPSLNILRMLSSTKLGDLLVISTFYKSFIDLKSTTAHLYMAPQAEAFLTKLNVFKNASDILLAHFNPLPQAVLLYNSV